MQFLSATIYPQIEVERYIMQSVIDCTEDLISGYPNWITLVMPKPEKNWDQIWKKMMTQSAC